VELRDFRTAGTTSLLITITIIGLPLDQIVQFVQVRQGIGIGRNGARIGRHGVEVRYYGEGGDGQEEHPMEMTCECQLLFLLSGICRTGKLLSMSKIMVLAKEKKRRCG